MSGQFDYRPVGVPIVIPAGISAGLKEQLEQINREMAANLVDRLYGDVPPFRRILAKQKSNPPPVTLKTRLKAYLGQAFLRAANALGEYNDYD